MMVIHSVIGLLAINSLCFDVELCRKCTRGRDIYLNSLKAKGIPSHHPQLGLYVQQIIIIYSIFVGQIVKSVIMSALLNVLYSNTSTVLVTFLEFVMVIQCYLTTNMRLSPHSNVNALPPLVDHPEKW